MTDVATKVIPNKLEANSTAGDDNKTHNEPDLKPGKL